MLGGQRGLGERGAVRAASGRHEPLSPRAVPSGSGDAVQ
jgi:hypothetical protein